MAGSKLWQDGACVITTLSTTVCMLGDGQGGSRSDAACNGASSSVLHRDFYRVFAPARASYFVAIPQYDYYDDNNATSERFNVSETPVRCLLPTADASVTPYIDPTNVYANISSYAILNLTIEEVQTALYAANENAVIAVLLSIGVCVVCWITSACMLWRRHQRSAAADALRTAQRLEHLASTADAYRMLYFRRPTFAVSRQIALSSVVPEHCSICLDKMSAPLCTACDHVFCSQCVVGLLLAATDDDNVPTVFTCPLCRRECTVAQTCRLPAVSSFESLRSSSDTD